jgi:hypothetical protein
MASSRFKFTVVSGPPSARTTRMLTFGRCTGPTFIIRVPEDIELPQFTQTSASGTFSVSQRGQKAMAIFAPG